LADSVKEVHRRYPTGVTIVTTCSDGKPYGLAVNAFSSLSLDPPLVLVCVASTSSTYPRLFDRDAIGINILAHDQAGVAATFARSGGDKFAGIEWRVGEHGAPVIAAVSAHLELRIETRIPAGTHTIFIGRVLDAAAADRPPLIYLGGSFYDGARLESAG
jgi:flavin reductase (DIM6/NTAB) family NADH-FMN oxidoreductase RutF